jgi:four helix bundle protein
VFEYWGVDEKEQKSWLLETESLERCDRLLCGDGRVFRKFPTELRRVVTQAIACSDSIHRNISEGYCRRSIREYLQFLYIALGSLGESVSGLYAYKKSNQLLENDFDTLDSSAYKLENGLLRLVESLEKKRDQGEWTQHLVLNESNAVYGLE